MAHEVLGERLLPAVDAHRGRVREPGHDLAEISAGALDDLIIDQLLD
jgi:hypothetical protein